MANSKKYTSKYFTNEEIDQVLYNASEGSVSFGQDTLGDDTIMRVFSVGANEDRDYRKNLWFATRDSEDGFTEETSYINDYCLGYWRIGKPYSMTITFTTSEKNRIRKTDKNQYIKFSFGTYDSSNNKISEGVKIHYAFSNSGTVQTKDIVCENDEIASVKIDDYLLAGTNNVTITITGTTTGTSVVRSVIYEVVDMSLSSTFNVAVPRQKSVAMLVNYDFQCSASGIKTLEFHIDGQKVASETSTSSELAGNESLDLSSYSSGEHILQVFGYVADDDGSNKFYSNTLFREFCIEGTEGKWIMASFDLTPGTYISNKDSDLIIQAEQYVDFTFYYGYYSSDGLPASVKWTLAGQYLHSDTAKVTTAEADGDPKRMTFQPQTSSDTPVALTASIGDEVNSYKVLVKVNSSGIEKTTTNLTCEFSAKTRSNSEPTDDRCVWASNGIQAIFPSGWAWSERQGWCDIKTTSVDEDGNTVENVDTALVISGGKQVVIPVSPLSNAPHIYGMAVEFDYEVLDVDDEDEDVITIWKQSQSGTEVGLKIKAESITAQSTNDKMYAPFPTNERQHLCFAVFATDDAKFPNLSFLYLEGTYKACLPYSDARWTNNANIVLGSKNAKATLRVYNIRVYSKAINVSQYLWNQAIDAGTIGDTITRNDIYVNGAISVQSMQNILPIGLIDGTDTAYNNIKTLENTDSKSAKVVCDYQYINPNDREKNFTVQNMIWWLQGTSSLRYPRKNFKAKTYKKSSSIVCKDWQGNTITKGLVQVVKGDMPCNELTFKADFMDSSCTRNATVARIFGDIEPKIKITDSKGKKVMLTPPQQVAENYESVTGHAFPYSIRTTPNSEAMMLFHRLPGDTSYTCLGQYTMLNDKGNEELYGFKSIYAPAPGHYDDTDLQWVYTDPCCQTVTDTYRKSLLAAGRIVRLYDNDETHCYEILDNSSEFANFSTIEGWDTPTQVNAQDKYKHLGIETAFDSRYPKIDDDDYDTQTDRNAKAAKEFLPLKAFIWWMSNRKEHFDDEIEQHVRVYNCAGYKVFYDRFGAVDQIKKNMMWTCYGEHSGATPPDDCPDELKAYYDLIWMPIRYDNDSTVDKRNTGSVFYDYEFTRDTEDKSSTGGYCYSGHDSVLWNNLEASSTFMDKYYEVDEAFYEAGLTIDAVLDYYVSTMEQWPEQGYNENMYYKYISLVISQTTTEEQKGWISFLQGMDKAHIIWWLRNRFAKYDADNGTGDFQNHNFSFIAANTPQGSKMYFTSGTTTKYGWRINKKTYAVDDEGNMYKSVERDENFEMEITKDGGLSIGDPVYINNACYLSKIDLHELAPYFSSVFSVANILASGIESQLKTLILGVSDTDYASGVRNVATDFSFAGMSNLTRLEYLDIKGFTNLSDCSWLSNLTGIKTLLAKGTAIKNFTCADGISFTKLQLPDGLQSMGTAENAVSNCNWQTLDYTPTVKLTTIHLDYMADEDEHPNIKTFIFAWLDMLEQTYTMNVKWSDYDLILTGVDWTDVEYHRLEQLMNLGNCQLSGHSYIKCSTEFDSQQMTELMAAFGSSIFTKDAALVIDCDSSKLVLGVNGVGSTEVTTYTDGDGNTYPAFLCGGSVKVVSTGFPIRTDADAGTNEFSITTSAYECTLNGSTGVITTSQMGYTTAHKIRVYAYNDAKSLDGSVDIYILPLTYPQSISIDSVTNSKGNTITPDSNGVYNLTDNGESYSFHRKYSPTPNANITSEKWEFSGQDLTLAYKDEEHTTNTTFVLKTGTLSPTEVTETLTYKSNFPNTQVGGKTISKVITLMFFTVGDIVRRVENEVVHGNIAFYDAIVPTYVSTPTKVFYLSSLELKNIFQQVTFAADSMLKNFQSLGYNILDYMSNCHGIICTDCTTLTGDVDVTKMASLVKLDLSGTDTQDVIGISNKSALTSLKMHAPTIISISNCPNLNISE